MQLEQKFSPLSMFQLHDLRFWSVVPEKQPSISFSRQDHSERVLRMQRGMIEGQGLVTGCSDDRCFEELAMCHMLSCVWP